MKLNTFGRTTRSPTTFTAVLRTLLGFLLIGAAVYMLVSTHITHMDCTKEVTGIVESIEEKKYSSRSSSRPVPHYRPVIVYEYNGASYSVTGYFEKNNYYTQGQEITVMIDPDHPGDYYLPDYGSTWYLYIIIVFGAGFMVFGLLTFKKLHGQGT